MFASFFLFSFPFFVSVCLCFVFSSLYRSLNILFVVLLITGCFCLRSSVSSPQQKCCFVGDFLFALWMVSFSMTLGRCCVHCLCFLCVVCGCCLLFLSHLNIWINVLDFLHCFSMIFFAVLLRVQEFKSFSILFLSFHLFLSLSMLLLF